MYEDARRYQNLSKLRKERFLRMQTLTRPDYRPTSNSSNTSDSQALRVALLAAVLFALSGLITGFAFGAFVHFSPGKTAHSPTNITTIQQRSGGKSPTATKKVNPVALGWPKFISPYPVGTEIADGTTYSISLQVTDKTNGNTWGRDVHASGITCKLWLVQRIPSKKTFTIPLSTLENVQGIQNSITGQVNNRSFPEVSGLNFDPATPQRQLCKANGQATWKYQVSQSVEAGSYDLVVLTDWDGKTFNWSWQNITIKRAD